jgi:hypothetical protein
MQVLVTSEEPRVVVEVWWGDCLLHAGLVAPGTSFGLGEADGDVPVSREVLGSCHETLVASRGGVPVVAVPARAQGSLRLAGHRPRSLELLRRGPSFRSMPSPLELRLEIGSEVELELGALRVRIARALAERAIHASPWPDPRLMACLVASALAVFAALVVVRQAMPPFEETTDEIRWDELWFSSPLFIGTEEPEEEPEDVEETSSTILEPGEEPGHDLASCRCRHDGAMGRPDAERGAHRYGVAGPPDNPDPHIARQRSDWTGAQLPPHGLVPIPAQPTNGPVAPWGRDESLGTESESASGHMWGDEIADARGDDRGMREAGRLRADKVIESTATHAHDGHEPPRVLHTGLGVTGPLRPSEVATVVATRFARFHGCYREALAAAPATEGRVELVLDVDTDGAVAAISLGHLSVPGEELPRCLRDAMEGLAFAPQDRGHSRVSYPLLFEAGSEAARHSVGQSQ